MIKLRAVVKCRNLSVLPSTLDQPNIRIPVGTVALIGPLKKGYVVVFEYKNQPDANNQILSGKRPIEHVSSFKLLDFQSFMRSVVYDHPSAQQIFFE